MAKVNILPSKVVALLIQRVLNELTARYFYEAAANWCRRLGYTNSEAFFKSEAGDENTHYNKLLDYLADWNNTPILPDIKVPDVSFTSLQDIFQKAYDMENDLSKLYQNDSAEIFSIHMMTFDFLQFFRNIQNESIIDYSTKLNQIELYLPTDPQLVRFDNEVLEG